MKTKIPSLSYNAMFKAVIANNKYILSALVKSILDYYNLDIDITNKELIIKNNELNIDNYKDKQLICDYIIKIDDKNEINIEINRSKYLGLSERNLTYSFKIYYEHFNSGDDYHEFNNYKLLQVNFNNYANLNGKSINRYYMIDTDDIENRLSNNFSILNVDIVKCQQIVYNKANLEGISDLEVFGAIISCEYLEDIISILERGLLFMSKKDKERFVNDIKRASENKDTLKAIKLENNLEERIACIKACAIRQATEDGMKQGIMQNTDNMIRSMLKKKMSYADISDITGKSIEYIKDIDH